MASYLEVYGEEGRKHERRVRIFAWTAGIVVGLALLGLILYSNYKNYPEEKEVQQFLDLLKNKDYQKAYAMWGCTEAHPCRDYAYQRFLEDWGPSSQYADAAAARVGSGDTCGTGVVVPVDFRGHESVPLWVEKASKVISFSPDPECRKKRIHLREFFHRIFG